jgi:hypothetical protein
MSCLPDHTIIWAADVPQVFESGHTVDAEDIRQKYERIQKHCSKVVGHLVAAYERIEVLQQQRGEFLELLKTLQQGWGLLLNEPHITPHTPAGEGVKNTVA